MMMTSKNKNSVPVSSKKRMADDIDDLDFALESKPTSV
jgi:hypothetical protein